MNEAHLIPNLLYDVLIELQKKSIAQTKKFFDHKIDEGIDLFLKDIEHRKLGFFSKESATKFPPLSLDWNFPSVITNALIDVDKDSKFSVSTILSELVELNCVTVQIRFYYSPDWKQLEQILTEVENTPIRSVELVMLYDDTKTQPKLIAFCQRFLRVKLVMLYSAPEEMDISESTYILSYRSDFLVPNVHCGVIRKEEFAINMSHFTEALNYNTCLNRKVSVDVKGNIKNCPSLDKSYGNIGTTAISEAIEMEGFKDLWNVRKDDIEVCRDCEFRYICSDCRAFEGDKKLVSGLYPKPAKCAYNPYTSVWE